MRLKVFSKDNFKKIINLNFQKTKTMKKIQLLVLGVVLYSMPIFSQQEKFIEVTGSAEIYIEADEIIFNIGISEYWENEFNNYYPKNESNRGQKIKILTIENQLIEDLKKIGISKNRIKSTDVGNSWRGRNEDIRIRKSFEISLEDFSLINQIISGVNTYGIEYMRIGELKNKDMTTYRKDVKKQALLAAKEKATYLVETLDYQLGELISIKELGNNSVYPSFKLSNSVMESSSKAIEPEKKIKLRYEILAKFEIAK